MMEHVSNVEAARQQKLDVIGGSGADRVTRQILQNLRDMLTITDLEDLVAPDSVRIDGSAEMRIDALAAQARRLGFARQFSIAVRCAKFELKIPGGGSRIVEPHEQPHTLAKALLPPRRKPVPEGRGGKLYSPTIGGSPNNL